MIFPLRCLVTAAVLGATAVAAAPIGAETRVGSAEVATAPTTPDFSRVEVAPTKTSIYIGTVSMTMPPFERRDGRFESTYVAKVFPYFFYNEQGTLSIDLPDAALRRLATGEAVEFSGQAFNAAREERRVEGKATPTDARSGRIKVRVFVSKRIELIFNSTYSFPGVTGAGAASPSVRPAVPLAKKSAGQPASAP